MKEYKTIRKSVQWSKELPPLIPLEPIGPSGKPVKQGIKIQKNKNYLFLVKKKKQIGKLIPISLLILKELICFQ